MTSQASGWTRYAALSDVVLDNDHLDADAVRRPATVLSVQFPVPWKYIVQRREF
jgi:hypothetical protein